MDYAGWTLTDRLTCGDVRFAGGSEQGVTESCSVRTNLVNHATPQPTGADRIHRTEHRDRT